MRKCSCCGWELEAAFRFCPGCGTAQRLKVVEHFLGVEDLDNGALRVSAYLTTPKHFRFSIWKDEGVDAAMSLHPAEAQRLAGFLQSFGQQSERVTLGESVRRGASVIGGVVRSLVR